MELHHTARGAARLSDVLKNEMGMSTGLMNRLKWQQCLFVGGQSVHTDYPVRPGDTVSVRLAEPAPNYPAQQGNLTILYEDDHMLAVDKPAGMLIHPSRSRNTDTLANFVLGYYENTCPGCAFHPITRLDRDTAGVVLIAKNAYIHALLQQTPMQKTYQALTFGGPADDRGVIDAPIARRPLPSLLRYVDDSGKPSVSEYQVLRRFDGCALLSMTPVTGRTHQLRVHCAYMGFPILGDPQYGSEASLEKSRQMGLQGQCLRATMLEFVHPITHKALTVCSRERFL